jgi:K(+)-stimulated pyrophosphate-energized sodium pump
MVMRCAGSLEKSRGFSPEKRPDYERCVAISTKGAQKEMVLPSILAIIAPIATGLIFGVPGVLGLLMED